MRHPRFGMQLKVEVLEQIKPEKTEEIEQFLSSGMIAGIGPATVSYTHLADIMETTMENYLYPSVAEDVDLLIRTGGESRISNFLLWQTSYSELYFLSLIHI